MSPPVFSPSGSQSVDDKGNETGREPKRGRTTKLFSVTEHAHRKLTKKVSNALEKKEKEKEKERESKDDKDSSRDHEDGVFSRDKDIPMAGVIHSLLFTYSYTRKGGEDLPFPKAYLCSVKYR